MSLTSSLGVAVAALLFILLFRSPAALQRCFVAWVAATTGATAAIAVDGKTVRRSYQKKGAKEPIHMVSAFAARQRPVLGQIKVTDKSNEIVAIPALLDLLAIEGAILTIDAMGCQRAIAQKIIDKKADYLLAVKGNQGSLRQDIEVFAAEQKAAAFKDTKRSVPIDPSMAITAESKRAPLQCFHDVEWLKQRHDWPTACVVST